MIDRKYPLEQIVEAYKYVEKGQKTGNVVITLEHSNKNLTKRSARRPSPNREI